jgi:FkbM family methyltransferase
VTGPPRPLLDVVLAELLRDSHRYVPGLDQRRPTTAGRRPSLPAQARDRLRDLVERAAARLGFSHRHFDPVGAGARLAGLLSLSDGLEHTYALLDDHESRRALIDLLKLRVLGPHHAPLRITPQAYRSLQARCDRELRVERRTLEVSDPWFTPLSLYRVPVAGGPSIALHGHSVDVVGVFELEQYSYVRGQTSVRVEREDVVLDVGACWGDTTLYFAQLVGPRGKVYAFEFDPENLKVLRINLELNPRLADRVEIVEEALWNRTGETLAFVPAGRMTALVAQEGPVARPRVSTGTVDEFVERAGIDRLAFVKMDVEGAEPAVLQGARGTLERFRPKLAIAAYHADEDLVRIPAQLEALGSDYRLYLDTFSPVGDETVLFARPA